MRFINIDPKRSSLKDGILTVKTDIGYDLHVAISPMLRVNEQMGPHGKPGFALDMALGEMNSIMLPQDPNLIKTQEQLNEFLKKISYIPESFDYDDFMIGFVYGDPQNPDNFKWMFQFRKGESIITSMIFQNGIDVNCPISTHSWFENNIFHGRFVVDKNDLLYVGDSGAGRVRVNSKQVGGYPVGDVSIIPEKCDEISVRFNIQKNKWYLHWLTKDDKDLGNPLEIRQIMADIKMVANTDRSVERPKVTERIQRKDVASIMVKAGVATILGR